VPAQPQSGGGGSQSRGLHLARQNGVNVDSPEPKQVDQVHADLLATIADARSGQLDLSNRLQSPGAQKNRSATLVVRQRLAAEWHSN
jgi:hypothetical protein